MPAMKRPAAARVSTGKRGRPETAEQKGEKQQASIVSALEKSELSTATLDLLKSVLPMALQPTPRHEFQEQAVQMLETELLNIEKSYEARLAELEAGIANTDDKRAELQQAADAAQLAADAKAAVVMEAKEALDLAVSKFKEANEVRAKEELAKTNLLESIESASEKADLLKLTTAMKESVLKAEEGSSADVLDGNLRLLVEDKNLLDAVKTCMKKASSEHSQFEKLVLKQLDGQLAATEKKLTALQSESASLKEQAEQKLSAAVTEVDVCLEAKAGAQEHFKEAAEGKKEADKAAKAAKAELKSFDAGVPGMQKKLEGARSQLAAFVNGAKSNFQVLKEGVLPSNEVEEAVDEPVPEPVADPEKVEGQDDMDTALPSALPPALVSANATP